MDNKDFKFQYSMSDGNGGIRIPLTQNKYAIIDEDDFERVGQHKWFTFAKGYGATHNPKDHNKMIWMHRFILDAPIGMEVDHINGNRLDNRKENLRLCTKSENQMNRSRNKNNRSGFKGIYLDTRSRSRQWNAKIVINRKPIYLGAFNTPQEAGKAYELAAKKYHGRFAHL